MRQHRLYSDPELLFMLTYLDDGQGGARTVHSATSGFNYGTGAEEKQVVNGIWHPLLYPVIRQNFNEYVREIMRLFKIRWRNISLLDHIWYSILPTGNAHMDHTVNVVCSRFAMRVIFFWLCMKRDNLFLIGHGIASIITWPFLSSLPIGRRQP